MRPWHVAACICAAALALLPVVTLPQDQPTYNVDVNVVNVLATVRDRNGRIVSNLAKEDFTLEEDGKKQEIRYFSRQTDLPLTIGLLVDTSMSQRKLIDTERHASYQFLEQVLRPEQDMAFVIHFDTEVELLQDLTNSRPLLDAALKKLETASLRGWQGRAPFPWPKEDPRLPGSRVPVPRIGTVLYDAVFLAAEEVLPNQAGRRAVIAISDGVDARSKTSEKSAIEAALRADTIVYSIRYYDPDAYAAMKRRGLGRWPSSRGSQALKAISAATGGRMFEVSKKLTLEQIFDQIQEELRNQYSVGYTPPTGSSAGYRKIKLTTKDGKLTVQARQGYYAK